MQTMLPAVLSFAGSDPTGGAGIQADIVTFASMGCHPLSVITAITVQDSSRVHDFLVTDSDWLLDQARALLEDMSVAAFKIGMIGSIENVIALASIAADYPHIPLVLDPVLASGAGHPLATEELIEAMRDLLLPAASIITPNSLEARRLISDEDDEASLDECAEALLDYGTEFVLITGSHEPTNHVVNTLYGQKGRIRTDSWARLPHSYHGSGCTLASAIAACLANGMKMPEAVREAQDYTWQTLQNGYRLGMGQHFPDRLFWGRTPEDDATNTSDSEQKPHV